MSPDLPSPTKRATMNPTPLAPSDPNDIRGSMQKQAQTGFEEMIAWQATKARRAVQQGHNLPSSFPNTRRPLGPSRTEPTLSFAPSTSSLNSQNPPTRFPPFQTDREILNLVFTDGKRPDELKPFGSTGSDYGGGGSRTNSRTASSGLFGTPAKSTTSMADDDGEDGFSMDEVFGKSSIDFKLPSSSQGDSQDSTRTVTQRMKRAYEGEDSVTTLVQEEGGEDDDMEATDVEDEGEDQVAPTLTNMFGQKTVGSAGERRIAGSKRAFGKTKSLPASAFTSMEF